MPLTKQLRPLGLWLAAVWAGCLLLHGTGCSRAFYRVQADKEVDYLVGQKARELNWTMPRFPSYADPRSRYADPTSPDAPSMPFDDPVAHRYMHQVFGMKAWPCWHGYGDWWEYENPAWRDAMADYAEITPKGAVKLTPDAAVRIGIVNQSAYRTQLETLYLSALDVSTERFRFVAQFYGTTDLAFAHQGSGLPGGEENTLSVLPLSNAASGSGSIANAGNATTFGSNGTSSNAFFQKQFATGGELMVGILNQFTFNFFGPDTNAVNSLLNFSLLQPLLRFGGRMYAMERLTIAERQLLANLRAWQRYRQGFYTQVVIGDITGVTGPTRDGGFAGGTGLSGFTGTGTGGFGQLGQNTGFSGSLATNAGGGFGATGGGTAGFAGGNAGLVQGFVGLVQQLQQIRNTQASLNSQVRTLGLLEASLAAGVIDIAQVDIFRQNIETERSNLLNAQVTLANTLDNYKATVLGLPPNTPIELDDSLVEQFRLVDPRTTAVQNRIDDFIDLLGDLPTHPAEANLRRAVTVVEQLQGMAALRFDAARADMQRLEAALPTRRKTLDDKQQERLTDDVKKLVESLSELEAGFAENQTQLGGLENIFADRRKTADEIVGLCSRLSGLTQELSLVQARARLESVTLDPVTLNPKRAIDIARANRLDWMNNRMSLVDTWRLIAYNANALKSGLTVGFNGSIQTKNKNPLNFNGDFGTLAATVQFDAPFTRRLERNSFKQSLISYQQTRRGIIAYQDQIYQRLRNFLRTLRQLQILMEIQRRAVVIAVRRVDQTRETLIEPPAPVAPGEPASELSPTAAFNLLNALSDLRNAQNNFMSVWLNHYETRMLLMRELGIMEIDAEGQWVDRPINEAEWLEEELCPLPPPVPNKWLREADIESAAEADIGDVVPGFGSRRADVHEEAPSIEQIFPAPSQVDAPGAAPTGPVSPDATLPLTPVEPDAPPPVPGAPEARRRPAGRPGRQAQRGSAPGPGYRVREPGG